MWDAPVVTLFFAKKSLTKTDLCAGALREGESEMLDLHFSGSFLLTASQKATNDISVHLFNHSSNSCKSYQQIQVTF
jgi:hypothetical protein